jgi:hypothetical protein
MAGSSTLALPGRRGYANELRQSRISNDEVNRSMLSMLASKRAYGRNLQEMILAGLRLELWDLKNQTVYFSLPQSRQPSDKVFSVVSKRPGSRREGRVSEGRIELDGMHLTRTKEKYYLFAIGYEDIFFDPDRIVVVNYGQLKYSVTLGKLAMFLRNDSVYGGSLRVRRVPPGVDRPKFMNHGALVTPNGEATLGNFVQQIIAGKMSTQQKVQSLLDFVTGEIRYDQREFYFGREFLQRFSETLLAREADCSNKSILFASMLEQLAIEYLLVYSKEHVFVAVGQDGFPNRNSYGFRFDRKSWVPAETTATGFRIGETIIDKPEALREIMYIQRPARKNELFTFPEEKLVMFN